MFVPLRQLFLQQQKPGALTSSYLWAKMDGSVWPDGTISACLTKACTRAKVPRLHTSNWRQFVALISKEKFTVKERANFGLEDNLGEDIEDELDLCSTNAYPISCGATRVLRISCYCNLPASSEPSKPRFQVWSESCSTKATQRNVALAFKERYSRTEYSN